MKAHRAFILVLIGWIAASDQSIGQELPMFGPLPKLGKNWKLRDQGTYGTSFPKWSWAVFTNSQNGDLMSFAAQKLGNRPAPKVSLSGPWLSTASEIFPGGNPMFIGNPGHGLKGNWIRNNVIALTLGDGLLKRNISQDALEYSIVFEDDMHDQEVGTNRLAHGYGLALGELRVFVQHTSTHVITSDDAQGMASSLMSIHAHQEAARNPDAKIQTQKP
jgi:hypothetical protein